MGNNFEKLPANIKDHINRITQNETDKENYREALAGGWLEKMNIFEKETELVEMQQAECFEKDNPNGALVMTYSGSLIKIGPLVNGSRNVEYTSIGLRTDVPEKLERDDTDVASDFEVDEVVEFTAGPIKKSSPIYSIAIVNEEMEPDQQRDTLAEVTQILSDDFLEVNKTIILSDDAEESEKEMSLIS